LAPDFSPRLAGGNEWGGVSGDGRAALFLDQFRQLGDTVQRM
jgi:hypothetical protein